MKKLFASVFIMMLVTSLFAGGGQSAPVTQAPAQGSIGPTNSNPLSDIRVRQALNYAIDKAALCKTILQDTVVLADSLTPNGEGKATGLNNYAYNPQKAMELLKEAKWDPNYVLNVRYYYQDQQTVDLMTAIQAYWEAVGVKADFRLVTGDLATLLWTMPKDPVNGPSEVDWDILYAALACMTLSDYYVRWVGGYTGNSFHPTDLAYDKLVEGVSNTTDPAKQRTGFQALQRYETDNAITVPLYYQPLFIFSRDNVNRVGDSNGNMQYSYNWNIVNWEVKPDASGKKILKTNSGPQDFFVHPWFNPGLPIYHKILYDCLLLHDGNLNVAGTGLASSYEVAPDSMSISFTLRNNLKWHDGSPVTVQDIKWSVEYALKIPTLNPIFSTTFNSLQGATEYKAGTARDVTGITTDRNKITFKFAKLDPNLLLTFGQFAPLPQKYFQGVDPAKFQQAPYFQNPVGSGPFMVKEAKMNDYSVYVPFKDYHGGVAKIDEIHATPSWDNDGNLIVNVTSGRVDYGFTKSSGDMIALGKIPGIKIYPVAMLYTRFMYFNTFPRKK